MFLRLGSQAVRLRRLARKVRAREVWGVALGDCAGKKSNAQFMPKRGSFKGWYAGHVKRGVLPSPTKALGGKRNAANPSQMVRKRKKITVNARPASWGRGKNRE